MEWRIRLKRRPSHVSPSAWILGNLWRKFLYAIGLHWKQRRVQLTWPRFTRLIRARMMEASVRWDRHLRTEPCVYCGKLLAFEKMTVEHVVPKSRGGRDSSLNKVGCCEPCNRKRGSMPLLHYLLERQGHNVRKARRNYLFGQQQRVRAERGLLLEHQPGDRAEQRALTRAAVEESKKYFRPPLATIGENAAWKAQHIIQADQKNKKDTDIDLRRRARG
jgi:5-methylcytosine-specific restriction endonuclease McrA